MLKTKHFSFDFKKTTETGTFEGLLSPYGNVDAGGDVVEPGAFSKNLAEKGTERPILWQHNTDMPLGTARLEDRPEGLWIRGQLLMGIPEADKAYRLIKGGVVSGLSIGYRTVRDEVRGGVRYLKELVLWEASIVTLPMNEAAQISTIKSLHTNQIELALKNFEENVLRELKGRQ